MSDQATPLLIRLPQLDQIAQKIRTIVQRYREALPVTEHGNAVDR